MSLADYFEQRDAYLKHGLVLCECGRYKPLTISETATHLYQSNWIKNFAIKEGEDHDCDPVWLKAELLKKAGL